MRRLTAASLQAILPGEPNVEVLDTGVGYFRVNARWPDGSRFKLDAFTDRIVWKDLSAASGEEPNGLYTALCAVLPAFFAETGRRAMLMSPANEEARRRLLARGAWEPQADGSYRWDLDAVA